MKYNYHIIVIGAGSGGLVVASGAAALGAKVALIESNKMGGDCLNTGCVPSKSFLRASHLAKEISNSTLFGIDSNINEVDMKTLMGRVHHVIDEIKPHDSIERYESLGVDVIQGKGKLIDPHSVQIGEKIITGKTIVIATGSIPSIPNISGLNSVEYLTNENIFDLQKKPEHLIVLGAGPIGLELGQGFCHLGSKVTIINRGKEIFKKDEIEVAPIMKKVFTSDGIQVKLNCKILSVQKKQEEISVTIEEDGKTYDVVGDALLVSLGRTPVTKELGLENLGVQINERGYIVTNAKLQTTVKNIYACGDVTGPYQFTHMAAYQAGIVIRNSIFHIASKLNYSAVPWTTYTKPEVAHVGHTEITAKADGVFTKSIIVPINEIDRAKAENDVTGFLKLILGKKNRIIGATLVGDKAGEIIPMATFAIHKKTKVSEFLNIIFSYPSVAEIYKFAALSSLKDDFKPWQSKLIKTIFLRK
jgi:pyruvate/2-oxoglutarate dehydrogenase complex dihydrolipoamide dehydrogenase (E3) component